MSGTSIIAQFSMPLMHLGKSMLGWLPILCYLFVTELRPLIYVRISFLLNIFRISTSYSMNSGAVGLSSDSLTILVCAVRQRQIKFSFRGKNKVWTQLELMKLTESGGAILDLDVHFVGFNVNM